jgi:hypothetical protein
MTAEHYACLPGGCKANGLIVGGVGLPTVDGAQAAAAEQAEAKYAHRLFVVRRRSTELRDRRSSEPPALKVDDPGTELRPYTSRGTSEPAPPGERDPTLLRALAMYGSLRGSYWQRGSNECASDV